MKTDDRARAAGSDDEPPRRDLRSRLARLKATVQERLWSADGAAGGRVGRASLNHDAPRRSRESKDSSPRRTGAHPRPTRGKARIARRGCNVPSRIAGEAWADRICIYPKFYT